MTLLAYITTSGAFFIMLYFSLSIARYVHSVLGPENAGKLLRVLFPKYFLWGLILSFFSTVAFYFSNKIFESATLFIVVILAGISRFILVPKINTSCTECNNKYNSINSFTFNLDQRTIINGIKFFR